MTPAGFARCVSFGVGFLSLSQEILLVRLVGFAHHSTPQAFSFVLLFFLAGIACGAYAGKRICGSRRDPLAAMAVVVLGAGAFDASLPFIAAPLVATGIDALMALAIFVAAALKSVAFPIAHHLGSAGDTDRLGSSVSKVYFFNIAGATLGPLLTGFVLLQYVGLAHALLLIAAGTLALGFVCAARAWPQRRGPIAGVAAMALLVLSPLALLRHTLIEDIVAADPGQEGRVIRVIENRSGIIHVVGDARRGDATYGGNVYDGRVNTDLSLNSNGINRAYMLAALHPSPRRVLMIGLSSGAWAAVVAQIPGVEQIDIVEINPGYRDLVASYPAVSGVLSDPRVTIRFDDGRRWLRANPGAKYDLIVMNTTLHWRAYATHLLSLEFLRELERHLLPGGLVAWNGTGLPDVVRTAALVFAHVRKYDNFVYASHRNFLADFGANSERVWSAGLPGRPRFSRDDAADARAIASMYADGKFATLRDVERATDRVLEVITDDNLLPEYRYGRSRLSLPGLD